MSCAPLEVKAMVDAFLFMFLQPTLKGQWGEWGDKTATKGELQRWPTQCNNINNKARKGVGKSCSPLEVMVMVDSLLVVLLQCAPNNA